MQRGITVSVNVAHRSSWQEKPRWLIACLCRGEHRFYGLLKKQKREPQNIHLLWKKKACRVTPTPTPNTTTQYFFNQIWLGRVELLSYLLATINETHLLYLNVNWKGKKAVRRFLTHQFDFRQRWKREACCMLMSPDIRDCLKYRSQLLVTFFFV